MVRWIWILVIACLLAVNLPAGELAIVGTVTEAPATEVDTGIGGELQYRQMVQGDIYLVGLAGVTSFNVPDEYSYRGNKCVSVYESLTGDVTDSYLGLGCGVQQSLPWLGLEGRLEGALEYHWLDSSVNETKDIYGHYWSRHLSQGFDLDNTWTLGIGTQLVKPVTDKVSIVGGVGYRVDLDEQKFSDSDVRFSLTGFTGNVGLEINLN